MSDEVRKTKRKGKLTLAIRSHVWHGGILHHACRSGSSHEGRVSRARKVTSRLGAHGELLCVIHHLGRLILGWPGLQVRILGRWGTVEGWASRTIWVTIGI